jgi:hypothetical protein
MRKLRSFLVFSLLVFSLAAHSQLTISGVVLDSATREPLSLASVYLQNTTVGTATNKQGEFSLEYKSGGYDLVISYTGYQTQTVRIASNEIKRLEVLLAKEEKNLGEVIIKASNEVADGWEKYGDFFFKNFIGATPNASQCTILNKEVLKFYFFKRSNKLKVLATEPIQVSNKALGYNLRYQLDSFVYYYNTDINSYRGFCLYSQMDGTDAEKKTWGLNRLKAYNGSKLQFMRSYYDSTLAEDGWLISMLDSTDKTKFNKINDPYDTVYYAGLTDSTQQIEIWYPRKLSIAYTKGRPENEYLKKNKLPMNVGLQVSYVDLLDGIAIKENGYYYDQKDWINQGYWSWKNLADQLPYDY